MMCKAFTSIFIVILAVQVTHQTPTNKGNRDVINILNSTYEKYLKIDDGILDFTDIALNVVYYNYKEYFTDIFVRYVQSLNDKLVNILDELKHESLESGSQKVIKCLAAERASVNEAIKRTIADFATCYYYAADRVILDLKKYLQEREMVHAKVQQQVDNLQSCEQAELLCLAKFIQEGHSILEEFEQFFLDNITELQDDVVKLVEEVNNCKLNYNLKANAKKILSDIVNCINS